jgi:hypothetical protein
MWVVSLTYGIAVMAVTSALAFGMIWSVEKLAQRGIRHDWRMTFGCTARTPGGRERGINMLTTRKQDRTRKLPTFEQTEPAVKRGVDRDGQGLLAIAMLIFALALCALVFQSGWKEISAQDCGADSSCQAVAAGTSTAK